MAKRPRPIVLTVLDGWGYRAETKGNAIALAKKPAYDELLRKFPNTLIQTSGPFVGLPEGQMGNSEVGHMNMGAGRIVHMDITRIDLMIATKQLQNVPLFQQAMERGRQRQLHFLGLLSDGGVHSHIHHLFALLEMAKQQKVEKVFVHCFMDGRDTPPNSGRDYVRQLQQKLSELRMGEIATLVGRYYAMDRDNRWERVELAYRALVHGEALHTEESPLAALAESYERGITDEFVKPIVITKNVGHGQSGVPVGLIRDEDAVIFYNFRADRARQMTKALAEPGFDKFTDEKRPQNLFYVAMTQYEKTWPWLKYVLAPEKLEHILAQVFADLHYKNLRTAETEKYAHVTYFFNGGVEKPFGGEERILVPSPKVATYDLKPEMSAAGITDTVVKAIEKGEFDAIIMNYANADMVGHSGKLEAAIKAVEAVDAGLGHIYQTLKPRGGAWIITADHGNAETMIDPVTGGPHTYHTTNPVPLILLSEDDRVQLKPGGSLRDIAPTMLGILGQPRPADMTGTDLRIQSK
jgi:2,3-bisphosphoglycerate-independent phosphoglycerate mutase